MTESNNGKVIRRSKNQKVENMDKEKGSEKSNKPWYKKRKQNKQNKNFTSVSTESLQKLADHFNNNRN